jgi:ribonuclease HI
MSSWLAMRFKGERVWVRADGAGQPVLDGQGRAEMKYRETDAKSYRPLPGNLMPDPSAAGDYDGAALRDAPAAAARPPRVSAAAKRPRAAAAGGAIEIWTDGACSGNPGPMGIGVVVLDGPARKEIGEYLGIGTNNIAELVAIERGVEVAAERTKAAPRRLRVYSDSAYSIGVLSKGWKAKANQDLVARIKRRLADLDVELIKVSGHAGVPENERCDALARQAILGRQR